MKFFDIYVAIAFLSLVVAGVAVSAYYVPPIPGVESSRPVSTNGERGPVRVYLPDGCSLSFYGDSRIGGPYGWTIYCAKGSAWPEVLP